MIGRADRSLLVIAAGVCGAIHVGKLPPALPALREALDIGLVQAGFLISMVQLAGMTLGLAVGLAADSLGLRRVMVAGLVLLAAASLVGGFTTDVVALLALRGLEGLGFLLTVMPAPSLIRRIVPPAHLDARMGAWAAYMPVATALALLVGPPWIAAWGWPAWWWLAGGLSATLALAVWVGLPADLPAASQAASAWPARLGQTLRAPGPWLVAAAFAVYSAQWLSMVGFLPSIYAQAGLAPAWAGLATAVAAGVNMVGTVGAGRLLQRGVAPPRLLQTGYGVMGVASVLMYAPVWPAGWLAAAGPFVAVLVFSSVGGLIPATLFAQAVRVAPSAGTVSTTVGWMHQWSSLGQFVGPPLVAWVATGAGDWSLSWVVMCLFGVLGLLIARALGQLHAQR
jgi:CP family cyanate transporter-like MFS transporter